MVPVLPPGHGHHQTLLGRTTGCQCYGTLLAPLGLGASSRAYSNEREGGLPHSGGGEEAP